nr:AMP-binding protein [Streptomyces albus]
MYRARGWWRPERLDDVVLCHAPGAGERPAVLGRRPLTHAQLASAVDAATVRLAELGLRAPHPVLVQLPNSVEMLVLSLALMRMGCPPILAHPALREHELAPLVTDLAPVAAAVPGRTRLGDSPAMVRELRRHHPGLTTTLVLDGEGGDADLHDLLRPGPPPADRVHRAAPEDVALYFLSSGTTGPPKAIPRSHESLGFVMRHAAVAAGLGTESVYLAALPTTHSFSFAHPGILGALAQGGAVVLAESGDVELVLELARAERPTHCALVPALVEQLLARAPHQSAPPPPGLVLQVGGARLAPATARRVHAELGWRLQQVYGMSEGLLCFTRLDDPGEVVAGTQGRPIAPGDELLVVGEDGRPVHGREQGELWTRGPSTITAYAGRAAREAGRFGPEGHYRTGDLVRLTPDGNLLVTGRAKDVINRAGEKIAADDVEAVIGRHPRVREVSVVGFPHPLYGEATCAVIVAEPGTARQAASEAAEPAAQRPPGQRPVPPPLTLRQLRAFLHTEGLAAFKSPDRLLVVGKLPRTGIGKVDKAAVRRLVHGEGEQAAPSSQTIAPS